MMTHYIITLADGTIIQSGSKPDADYAAMAVATGQTKRVVAEPIDPAAHYWDNAVLPLSARPSPFAELEMPSATWVDPADLSAAKVEAAGQINREAARARGRFVTLTPGMSLIYDLKRREAEAYLAETPEPATLDDYPMIAAEVGLTEPTALALAQAWNTLAQTWVAAAAQIEGARHTGLQAVDTSTTLLEIDTAVTAALAALAAI